MTPKLYSILQLPLLNTEVFETQYFEITTLLKMFFFKKNKKVDKLQKEIKNLQNMSDSYQYMYNQSMEDMLAILKATQGGNVNIDLVNKLIPVYADGVKNAQAFEAANASTGYGCAELCRSAQKFRMHANEERFRGLPSMKD